MGKQYTFEIRAFCVVNENDWGEPVTEQSIKESVSDLFVHDLCFNAEVVVANLMPTDSELEGMT